MTVRRMWPDVLEAVKGLRRFTWTLLSHNAQVAAVENGRLTLAMVNAGARDSFSRGGSEEIVREALIQVLGADWKVEAIVDPSVSPGAGSSASSGAAGSGGGAGRPAPSPSGSARPSPQAPTPAPGPGAGPATGPAAGGAAPAYDDDSPSADDADADDSGLSHHDLLARELGAKVIGEYDNG